MGNSHVSRGEKVTYTYCAPASGSHVNLPGVAGPIAARVYGPTDSVVPQGWIHNLEHGGLVILYKTDSAGATPTARRSSRPSTRRSRRRRTAVRSSLRSTR